MAIITNRPRFLQDAQDAVTKAENDLRAAQTARQSAEEQAARAKGNEGAYKDSMETLRTYSLTAEQSAHVVESGGGFGKVRQAHGHALTDASMSLSRIANDSMAWGCPEAADTLEGIAQELAQELATLTEGGPWTLYDAVSILKAQADGVLSDLNANGPKFVGSMHKSVPASKAAVTSAEKALEEARKAYAEELAK